MKGENNMHIYFLQVMSCLENEEHYENVYCTRARAIKEGKIVLELFGCI